MLSKLLKTDLRKNMRWLWIIFVATIGVSIIDRACKEIGEVVGFFKILSIIFDSVFYSLLVNCVLQPFLRNFTNFTKSFYNDESYLTHTLPVTKKQLLNSKMLTALIEMVLGFATMVVSLLIVFGSPTMLDTLKLFVSMIVTGEFSVVLFLVLFVLLVLVEFLMFVVIIFYSIVLAYREKEKRLLKTFLLTAVFSFAALSGLSVFMIIVLAINGVDLTSTTLVLSSGAFLSVIITGIIVYSIAIGLFYFLTRKAFLKGVNVD